jgi:hypothetical protein
VFDEILAHPVWRLVSMAFTVRLSVDYHRVVPLGSTQAFEAQVDFDRLPDILITKPISPTSSSSSSSSAATSPSSSSLSSLSSPAIPATPLGRHPRQVHVSGRLFSLDGQTLFSSGSAIFQMSAKFNQAKSKPGDAQHQHTDSKQSDPADKTVSKL